MLGSGFAARPAGRSPKNRQICDDSRYKGKSTMQLLAELKRRNVIRMAGLYLVGAWLLTQVAGTVLPMFGAPDWLPRSIVIVLALGLIPTLVFSWVFELTPDGLKRDAEVPPEQSIAPQTARRMDRMIIAVLLLALTYFGFDKLVLSPRRDAALVVSTTQAVTATNAAAAPKVDSHSIAVLPFVNMSGDAANEYFSDGISEEILNVLARTADLQVAARTSSFSFKGKNEEVPDIARKLQVRMVLEGSVRKQDDRVRITAQLIDAQKGYHVWSQTYDRKLADIFAIQDEIAKAIGDELQVQIVGAQEQGKSSAGTRNLVAYDLYLRAIALWQTRREDALWQAVDLLGQAIQADPEFAQARAGQALVYAVIGDYSARIPFAESLARARDAAEQALVLDASMAEPYAALGKVANSGLRRASADTLLRRAIALRPSFASAYQWRGTLLMSRGDLAGGLASLERASVLDPRSLIVAENHSWILMTLGRYADAKARCGKALEVDPAYAACMEDIGIAELLLGNFDAGGAMFDREAALLNPSASTQGRELAAALGGRADRRALASRYAALEAESWLKQGSGNTLTDYDIAVVLMLLGDHGLVLDYLERLAGEDNGLADWAAQVPVMDPIRCDARFVAVVQKLKMIDAHAARVCGQKH
jgi:TolB-like protein/Tfp pilus assembly protein PilF